MNKFDVTWLSGMPRSGTTWLSQIFASSPNVRLKFCPLFSYEFKNLLDENSSDGEWEKLFADVYNTKSEYLDQDYLRNKGLIPEFSEKMIAPDHLVIKSTRYHNLVPNMLELLEDLRVVYIVRHPCATIYSWLTSPYEFPQNADPKKEWRSGKCRKTGPGEYWGFDDWKKVNLQALNLEERFPLRFKIIRYEYLVANTEQCVLDIFSFLGIEYGKQTKDFIAQSQSKNDPNRRSVFKGQGINNDWRTMLDSYINNACIEELRGTKLERFLSEVF